MNSSHMTIWKHSRRALIVPFGLILLVLAAAATGTPSARAVAQTLPAAKPLTPPPQQIQADVRSVLRQQESAWNHGNLEAFMSGYKDSPETTFISKHVEHGYREILKRYQRRYATRSAMGILRFSGLHVHVLCANYAVATGEFHLARNPAGGGDASGVFSLLFQKTASGWKIVLDHTSAS
jgi:ketosteroid isomerase-like protein